MTWTKEKIFHHHTPFFGFASTCNFLRKESQKEIHQTYINRKSWLQLWKLFKQENEKINILIGISSGNNTWKIITISR